jgi:TolB-like protein/Tfp pilus assembly protein PilF
LATIYRKMGVSSKIGLGAALEPPATKPDPSDRAGPAKPEKPSIAVLAFENMSGDPEQEYFSDGITQGVITALSRSPWLFIIARNSTFTYKGTNVDVRRVAIELGVRFVLEGSMRRSGDKMRVTAQLIDGTTGGHVWSERYDGQLADVFDLQDEITRNVVAAIQTTVHLSTIEEPVERVSRPDLAVWQLTMRSWHLLYDFNADSYAYAKTLVERALAIDHESCEANMVLSLINHHIALMGFAKDYQATAETAYALGRRAIQLDSRNEYAHWAFGISCWGLKRYDESQTALERALEINRNCSVAMGSLGTCLALVGRPEETILRQEMAIRSNPHDPSIFFRFSGLALANYLMERHVAASEWAGRVICRMPSWHFSHLLLIASLAAQRKLELAREAVASCLHVLPKTTLADLKRLPVRDVAIMDELRRRLQQAGLAD